ncbi:MAG: hypothetical protein V2A73_07480 [Pseudomonadota bacterium]
MPPRTKDPKNCFAIVRCTERQRDIIARLADRRGLSVSSLLLATLLDLVAAEESMEMPKGKAKS